MQCCCLHHWRLDSQLYIQVARRELIVEPVHTERLDRVVVVRIVVAVAVVHNLEADIARIPVVAAAPDLAAVG